MLKSSLNKENGNCRIIAECYRAQWGFDCVTLEERLKSLFVVTIGSNALRADAGNCCDTQSGRILRSQTASERAGLF